jgi:F-type H+-transporting ATPase subunit a
MRHEFLSRVRITTIVLTVIGAIVAATYASPLAGLGLAAGAAWSLVNLALIEALVVAVLTPVPSAGAMPRALWALGGMAALMAAGGWLLFHLPALWLTAGFSMPFAVITLKAVSRVLLESAAWRTLVRSPWRATLAVVVVILAAWWMVPARTLGQRSEGGAPAAADSVAAAGGETAASGDSTAAGEHGGAGGSEHGGEGGAAEHGAAGAEHGGKSEGESGGVSKFPNVITLIVAGNHNAPWAHQLHYWEPILFAFFVGILVIVAGVSASRNPKMIPGGFQNGAEMLVESLYDFVGNILGARYARRYFPLLGSLFVYIFAMNLFGMLPLMDSPTSNLNVTFALGLTVFVYVQYVGMRSLGFIGYFDHMLGNPRNVTGWVLAPLMFPIHILGELAKPISLSCRLFGNIFGEDMLMVGFATLGVGMLKFSPVGVPLHAIFYPLALLTSTLQAFVFTVLTTIYILLMLPHEDHGHEGETQHAH